ncbi:MAG: hypothetical protein ACI4EK_09015 [Wujia sp.]
MGRENETFSQTLSRLYEENHFIYFDEFIVRKFVQTIDEEPLTDEIRKKAYQNFYQAIGKVEIANPATMHRWFGLSGYAKPNREHIFQMAFCLRMSRQETEEYLLTGLNENSFQINDYHEMIYLYGIENTLPYDKCQDMIDMFEQKLTTDLEVSYTRNTGQMMREFEHRKNLPVNEFMLFMIDNVMYFKGYSNTTLRYWMEYRRQVLHYIREDAKQSLEQLLAETDYAQWKRKNPFMNKKNPYEMIRKYLGSKNTNSVSQMWKDNILELAHIAYSMLDNSSLVHDELFLGSGAVAVKSGHSEVRNMTMKHMSDLLRVAQQKELAFRILAAIRMLEHEQKEEPCPDEVLELLRCLNGKTKAAWNCGAALKWLKTYQKEHKRRQLLVQRGDLLPFVLYVAQRRYLEEIRGDMELYEQQEARKLFQQMADCVLTACNMQRLQENRELDAVLLACFQEEEMYGYPDVLEALYGE